MRYPVSPEEAKTIADFCRMIREREKKSTREWADEIDLNFSYVSKVETGRVEGPLNYVKKIKRYCSKNEWMRLITLLTED